MGTGPIGAGRLADDEPAASGLGDDSAWPVWTDDKPVDLGEIDGITRRVADDLRRLDERGTKRKARSAQAEVFKFGISGSGAEGCDCFLAE